MTTSRDAFLQKVRNAVAQGNSAGMRADIPSRGTTGYQGGGANAVERFCEQFAAAGGIAFVVPDADASIAKVLELVEGKSARKILLGRGDFIDTLSLAAPLRNTGATIHSTDTPVTKEDFFAADLCISAVDYLIAETGSLVVSAKQQDPRSVSLISPIHIAVAHRKQIVPDLFDLFPLYPTTEGKTLPSCISLITGPSKTGDIELKLVTGVHGPKEVYVVLVDSP